MRAAHDALDEGEQNYLRGLTVYHSLAYSQAAAGAVDAAPAAISSPMPGARYRLAGVHPESGRRSLFNGWHACQIRELGWPEGSGCSRRPAARRASFTTSGGPATWWSGTSPAAC
ncbi:hypothetical protein [Streptomyces sp. CA-106131]|uniref:hypothetical protein n=1 Tax=Streptomyces sp. CA-106131 TaxID=3240045 RepID=UPI003D907BB7